MGPGAPRPLALAAAIAALALVVGPAGAQDSGDRIFLPGRSLDGVAVGSKAGDVANAWGQRHGVCRDCSETTWYFNETPFEPQGTGVVLDRGRVTHAFTVWKPDRWRTAEGLALGDPGGDVGAAYGLLTEHACRSYTALVLEEGRAWSVFYVYDDELWGFGLMERRRSPCL